MKTTLKIMSVCAIVMASVLIADLYYTHKNSSKTSSLFIEPPSTYTKVLIHNIDTGYAMIKNSKKIVVTYRMDNGKWVKQYFWDTELTILKGNDDTSEITNVSRNKNQ